MLCFFYETICTCDSPCLTFDLLLRGGILGGGTHRPQTESPCGQHEKLRQALESQPGAQSAHATQERLQLVDGRRRDTAGQTDGGRGGKELRGARQCRGFGFSCSPWIVDWLDQTGGGGLGFGGVGGLNGQWKSLRRRSALVRRGLQTAPAKAHGTQFH